MGAAPATFGQRLVAVLIDAGIVLAMFVPAFIVVFIIGAISDILGVLIAILLYLAVVAAALYIYLVGIGMHGQTPGKRMQGVKVVNDSGATIGIGGAVVRWLVSGISNSIVCGLPLGAAWMLWDGEKKTLYDKILGNQAIQVEKGELLPIFPNGKPF